MKANRKDTFITTIDTHKKIIFKIVNSYCQNKEDRKDLEQEIIIQLWNSFDKYNDEYKYSTWMYRIALNVAISFYRKEKKWSVKNDFYNENSIYSIEDENENKTELDYNIKLLQEFINNLNELNKALMVLYLEEKPYDEIAEILGITKTNVATKISRLKLILKKNFKKYKVMEAFELKKLMKAYDNELDKTLLLNKSSVKKLQLKKSQNSTKKILRHRIFEVVIFGFLAIFLGWYTANNWGQTHLVICGIIVHVFALVALVGSIGQVVLLQQIDFSKPIVEIRKKIEMVNSHGLLFVKLIFLSAPVWWSYVIVGIDLFLDFDLYIHLEQDFMIRYLVINFLLIIPLVWVFNKLSNKNLHLKWVRKTIRIFAGTKTMIAMEFLNDIEEFEN